MMTLIAETRFSESGREVCKHVVDGFDRNKSVNDGLDPSEEYLVLSDSVKKRDYDNHMRKKETKSLFDKSLSTSRQDMADYCSEESRRIQYTKCGHSHIWICTNRTKSKARWCQGMVCRPNRHRPSFLVNMVGLEKGRRSNSSRYPWDLDAEMTDEEEEFELWLQQALASGLFCETSKRRKSWSPFKLPQKKGNKQRNNRMSQ
ncbi:uncharacterized protein [Rutidosis leptorrhynchoides]|uniref:uncharacterized protein isoform X2 n=1 Tax=Rutidosis leptorrhynchoides TaxID=125765 RepID=UPI003A997DB6